MTFSIVVFVALVALAVFVFKSGTPAAKGKRGEERVYRLLKRLPDEYHLFNDVLLKTKNGRTVQIDHVVVSPYGMFAIETKNYQGIIIGNGNSDEWRQNIWGNEYRLYNPEMQNLSHVSVLRQMLPYKAGRNVHSIVVFMDKAQLNLRNIKESVIYAHELPGEIESYKAVIFTEDEVAEINNILHKSYVADEDANKTHNAEVRQAKHRRAQAVALGICPLCGGHLVLRSGRYGSFWGCSNYPKCKFARER